MTMINYRPIGIIRTPYKDDVPRPMRSDHGEFRVEVNREFSDGLRDVDRFDYIYLIFHLDRVTECNSLVARPPFAPDLEVGLFASRSPRRPNPIALTAVKVISVDRTTIRTSPIDALDGSPLLDIKPYIGMMDSKPGAGNGWFDDISEDFAEYHGSLIK